MQVSICHLVSRKEGLYLRHLPGAEPVIHPPANRTAWLHYTVIATPTAPDLPALPKPSCGALATLSTLADPLLFMHIPGRINMTKDTPATSQRTRRAQSPPTRSMRDETTTAAQPCPGAGGSYLPAHTKPALLTRDDADVAPAQAHTQVFHYLFEVEPSCSTALVAATCSTSVHPSLWVSQGKHLYSPVSITSGARLGCWRGAAAAWRCSVPEGWP